MRILYIMGKSSSGKDTINSILKQKLDVEPYVMYTTRPMRQQEVNGENYIFIRQNEMQQYIEGKKEYKVIESRTYQTVNGPWIYATIKDYQFEGQKDMIMIGTLESYIKVRNFFQSDNNIEVIPIYIEVPDNIRLKRAIEREEKQKEPQLVELCRRFIADSSDFSEENLKRAKILKRFQNINLDDCICQIIQYLL